MRQRKQHVLEAVEMYKRGLTFSEIAEILGISRGAVSGACHRAGLSCDPERKHKAISLASSAAHARRRGRAA